MAKQTNFCLTITHFSIQPRYDFALSLSESDMRTVLSNTKTIRDFLKQEIPELFHNNKKIQEQECS
ncbi:MAG: hypothetical protein FWH53_04130 [Leptospirales bacterium]|nr:hypothetical protein [Leptospirales bacterium]